MGEGLAPVPAKLVAKIQRGDFVDMAELLRDNIEAERRGRGQESGSTGSTPSKAARREVPDLPSWIQCFGVFTSVVCAKAPERVTQLLAYQTMLVREARRCGGGGWQAYDSMFRQQAANSPGTDWSKINGSLFAVTFLTQQNGRGKCCKYCLESDHLATECALAPVKGDNQGLQQASKAGSQGDQRTRRESRRARGPRGNACYNWNDGLHCEYGVECVFRHECEECGGDHRRINCPEPPARRTPRKRPRMAMAHQQLAGKGPLGRET